MKRFLPALFAVAVVGGLVWAGPRSSISTPPPSATSPLTVTGANVSMTAASASTSGYLPLVGGVLVVDAGVTVRNLSTSIASGSVALQTLTGAKTCLGTSGVGCLTYDGTNIASSVGHSVTGNILTSVALYAAGGVGLGGTGTLTTSFTGTLAGATSLAAVTSTVPAVSIYPRAAVDANDLVLRVSDIALAQLFTVDNEGDVRALASLGVGAALAFSATAPTSPVACTTPTITHGTATSFQADVGTTCAGVTTFAFTLPTATNGWDCTGRNKTAGITRQLVQSAESTTSATMTNVDWAGTATAFTDGDDLVISCTGR
ncbi:MAG: hypothetical protein RL409_26 [Gemmatimonadota bacterium]